MCGLYVSHMGEGEGEVERDRDGEMIVEGGGGESGRERDE